MEDNHSFHLIHSELSIQYTAKILDKKRVSATVEKLIWAIVAVRRRNFFRINISQSYAVHTHVYYVHKALF